MAREHSYIMVRPSLPGRKSQSFRLLGTPESVKRAILKALPDRHVSGYHWLSSLRQRLDRDRRRGPDRTSRSLPRKAPAAAAPAAPGLLSANSCPAGEPVRVPVADGV